MRQGVAKMIAAQGSHTPDPLTQAAFRALADPTRREIITMLGEGERTVADVASHFAITRAAVKKHLIVLEEGQIVTTERRGRETFNKLEPLALKRASDWLRTFEVFWDDRLFALKEAVENDVNQGKVK